MNYELCVYELTFTIDHPMYARIESAAMQSVHRTHNGQCTCVLNEIESVSALNIRQETRKTGGASDIPIPITANASPTIPRASGSPDPFILNTHRIISPAQLSRRKEFVSTS